MKIGPIGTELFHEDRQTGRQTDGPTYRHHGTKCYFFFFLAISWKCPKTFLKRQCAGISFSIILLNTFAMYYIT
jgi:hypothetical protein